MGADQDRVRGNKAAPRLGHAPPTRFLFNIFAVGMPLLSAAPLVEARMAKLGAEHGAVQLGKWTSDARQRKKQNRAALRRGAQASPEASPSGPEGTRGPTGPLTPIGNRTGDLAASSGALSPRRQAPVCSDDWRNGDQYTEVMSCGAGLAAPAAGVRCSHAADHSRQTVDRAPRQRAGSGMSECGDERAASRGEHSER